MASTDRVATDSVKNKRAKPVLPGIGKRKLPNLIPYVRLGLDVEKEKKNVRKKSIFKHMTKGRLQSF